MRCVAYCFLLSSVYVCVRVCECLVRASCLTCCIKLFLCLCVMLYKAGFLSVYHDIYSWRSYCRHQFVQLVENHWLAVLFAFSTWARPLATLSPSRKLSPVRNLVLLLCLFTLTTTSKTGFMSVICDWR